MWRDLNPSHMMALLGPPIIAACGVWLMHLLQQEVLAVCIIWFLVSIPVGMLFGHCALSEAPEV